MILRYRLIVVATFFGLNTKRSSQGFSRTGKTSKKTAEQTFFTSKICNSVYLIYCYHFFPKSEIEIRD